MTRDLVRLDRKKILAPVRPNAGIEASYRRKLDRLIEEMARSLSYWLSAAYRGNEPEIARLMAEDASPAMTLRVVMRKLSRRWQRNFDDAAPRLADYFATAAKDRSDATLRSILRRGGFSVKFTTTPAINDALQATIGENVALIKSIASEHLSEVEGLVMRSVAKGGDLRELGEALEARYGVTRRRAELISRDQNKKATAVIARTRQISLGIERARWLHSAGGKTPRPSHVKASRDRVTYDIRKGWFDPDVQAFIYPGELINCFPGSTEIEFADCVEKAYRRRYSGETVTIVTSSGKTLCGTPNHPILTSNGWRAIGTLDEGDDVVEIAEERVLSVKAKDDVDQAIPSIADVFRAVSESSEGSRLEVALRDDFHGDGASDSDVDIVLAARPLRVGREPGRCERGAKIGFSDPDYSRASPRFARKLLARCFRSASYLVRATSELFSPRDALVGHPHETCRAFTAKRSSGSDYQLRDRSASVPIHKREFEDAAPGLELSTQKGRVISVERRFFSGHVYNLQTAGGWYVAGGIIAHNCRCVAAPVIPGLED